MSNNPNASRDAGEGAVPLFGTWRNAYLTVVAVFVVEVALFYGLARIFS